LFSIAAPAQQRTVPGDGGIVAIHVLEQLIAGLFGTAKAACGLLFLVVLWHGVKVLA
jgi:hypothetical protein